ncbi:lipocalin family protein [Mucilaginibacter sp. SP1R1]|uniref:lipocalin family protein n=1 Tax=Mucilaginibacter sp. SP1R1 TaxID=2723091 RepID=UPI001618F911|nr:lipocalin family protein [Mucilaginibacter sp. SP1R1]MBB6150749.1 hypothetical protein [Mucilaginibacter sp. SP1R1]
MKNKIPLLFILGLISINLLSNSCKKGNNSNIPHLLTNGTWQLATLQATNYIGDSQIGNPDTLNVNCDSVELFTFKTDNTCTYTNFDCLPQTTSGTWTLTENNVFFTSDMICKDTTATGTPVTPSPMPFSNTKIVTLGVYSMVLETGDVQPNYSSTKKRRVVRYGFIRRKAISTN